MAEQDSNDDEGPGPTRVEQAEVDRLRAEIFAQYAELAKTPEDAANVRQALRGSFMLASSATMRAEYDDLRAELDAFLTAKMGGVGVADRYALVLSPDIAEEPLQQLVAHLLATADEEWPDDDDDDDDDEGAP